MYDLLKGCVLAYWALRSLCYLQAAAQRCIRSVSVKLACCDCSLDRGELGWSWSISFDFAIVF